MRIGPKMNVGYCDLFLQFFLPISYVSVILIFKTIGSLDIVLCDYDSVRPNV